MTLKEQLFNLDTVSSLTKSIKISFSEFNEEAFIEEALIQFKDKELKERITVLTHLLEKYLPSDFLKATAILLESKKNASSGMFVYGSFLEYVEFNGCNELYVDYSLEVLEELTKLFSAEFVIRRFFNEFLEKTYNAFIKWSQSDDYDVRRLASEGSRPKLPWAVKIDLDYTRCKPILDSLFYDDVRYVTRSVANHLNDISKIDPDFVLSILKEWKKSERQNASEMKYIINHSLRTLVKKGHVPTLNFLGFNNNVLVTLENLTLNKKSLKIGETVEFSFDVIPEEDSNLIIDYIIEYPSSTKKISKKVYKLKVCEVKKGKKVVCKGKRSFKEISTRKMKVGTHKVTIQVNGKEYLNEKFELIQNINQHS